MVFKSKLTKFLLAIVFCMAWLPVSQADELDFLSDSLEKNSQITHVSVQDAKAELRDWVLFDVREEDEYLVSHLKNAIRLDQKMKPEIFLDLYGDLISEKPVLFYCSVGMRSTNFAENVHAVRTENNVPLMNLKGGLFEWHNQQYPLVNQQGSTDFIHPYNWLWKRLVVWKAMTREI